VIFVFACPTSARRSVGGPFGGMKRDVVPNSTISQTLVFLFGMKKKYLNAQWG